MKLIEYSNLVGFVVATDREKKLCLYYYADITPSADVIKAIEFACGDVYLIPTNNADFALKVLDLLHVPDTDYLPIFNAIREVSGNEI